MRTNLKIFRVQRFMTQEEMAKLIGCNRATYSAIESGKRFGSFEFWKGLQTAFGIKDSRMWHLMKLDDK